MIGIEILQILITTATPSVPELVELWNEFLDRPTAPSASGGGLTLACASAPTELRPGKPKVTDSGEQARRQWLVARLHPDTMLLQPEATTLTELSAAVPPPA